MLHSRNAEGRDGANPGEHRLWFAIAGFVTGRPKTRNFFIAALLYVASARSGYARR
jgi:hypothetical protein